MRSLWELPLLQQHIQQLLSMLLLLMWLQPQRQKGLSFVAIMLLPGACKYTFQQHRIVTSAPHLSTQVGSLLLPATAEAARQRRLCCTQLVGARKRIYSQSHPHFSALAPAMFTRQHSSSCSAEKAAAARQLRLNSCKRSLVRPASCHEQHILTEEEFVSARFVHSIHAPENKTRESVHTRSRSACRAVVSSFALKEKSRLAAADPHITVKKLIANPCASCKEQFSPLPALLKNTPLACATATAAAAGAAAAAAGAAAAAAATALIPLAASANSELFSKAAAVYFADKAIARSRFVAAVLPRVDLCSAGGVNSRKCAPVALNFSSFCCKTGGKARGFSGNTFPFKKAFPLPTVPLLALLPSANLLRKRELHQQQPYERKQQQHQLYAREQQQQPYGKVQQPLHAGGNKRGEGSRVRFRGGNKESGDADGKHVCASYEGVYRGSTRSSSMRGVPVYKSHFKANPTFEEDLRTDEEFLPLFATSSSAQVLSSRLYKTAEGAQQWSTSNEAASGASATAGAISRTMCRACHAGRSSAATRTDATLGRYLVRAAGEGHDAAGESAGGTAADGLAVDIADDEPAGGTAAGDALLAWQSSVAAILKYFLRTAAQSCSVCATLGTPETQVKDCIRAAAASFSSHKRRVSGAADSDRPAAARQSAKLCGVTRQLTGAAQTSIACVIFSALQNFFRNSLAAAGERTTTTTTPRAAQAHEAAAAAAAASAYMNNLERLAFLNRSRCRSESANTPEGKWEVAAKPAVSIEGSKKSCCSTESCSFSDTTRNGESFEEETVTQSICRKIRIVAAARGMMKKPLAWFSWGSKQEGAAQSAEEEKKSNATTVSTRDAGGGAFFSVKDKESAIDRTAEEARRQAFRSPLVATVLRYWEETPRFTRFYLSTAFTLSFLSLLYGQSYPQVLSPAALLFDVNAIREKKQFYRLLTSLFFFGPLSLPTLLCLSFVHAYLGGLEQHFQRPETLSFPPPSSPSPRLPDISSRRLALAFSRLSFLFPFSPRHVFPRLLLSTAAAAMTLAALKRIPNEHVLQCISTSLLLVWSRLFPSGEADFYGLFTVSNEYLPFFFLAQNWLLDGRISAADLYGVGIAAIWLVFVQQKLEEQEEQQQQQRFREQQQPPREQQR